MVGLIRFRGKKKKVNVVVNKGKFIRAYGAGRAKSFKRKRR